MDINESEAERAMAGPKTWGAALFALALSACGPTVEPGETTTDPIPDQLGPVEHYGLSDAEIAAMAPDALVKKALERSDVETLDAAAAEDKLSLALLCLAHYYGEKTAQDAAAAASACARGDKAGVPLATFMLSEITRAGEGGLPADARAADALLRKAADAGDARAQAALIERVRASRPAEARALAEKCGAQGNQACRFVEAQMKIAGQGGPRDTAAGQAALDELAAAYYAPAVRETGKMLRDGRLVNRDIDEAIIRFRRAEVLGDAESSFLLGQLAEAGDGMPKSEADAAAFYRTAANAGYAPAEAALKRLEKK